MQIKPDMYVVAGLFCETLFTYISETILSLMYTYTHTYTHMQIFKGQDFTNCTEGNTFVTFLNTTYINVKS